ncbi:nucleocapsid protein [Drosophila obscura sigmavirus 10A]|uniref:Nucleoprotein n=98 Tax=Drosophila obscura sigmavirus TaxID=948741 RepID=C8CJE6_9RHAB|nr:nucleocapsid protein [Drosophila obscura sigmavirus 10A]ACU65439.1 nucleocapsid protein [Drosophila obscura sigmavirus 10A]
MARLLDAGVIYSGSETVSKPIQLASFSRTSEGEYPAAFFNPPKRPSLSLVTGRADENNPLSLGELGAMISTHLLADSLNVEWVKTFLYRYFESVKEECADDWSSYGNKFRTTEQTKRYVSPWNLIEVKIDPGIFPDSPTEGNPVIADRESLRKLVIAVTGIHRLNKTSNAEYRTLLGNRLSAFAAVKRNDGDDSSTNFFNFGIATTTYATWNQDVGFCRMIAALDMFFYKYKHHPDAIIRWGTIVSRDKDLGALLALEDLRANTASDTITNVLSWVWLSEISSEFIRLSANETDQKEALLEHSYFHYQSEMRLVNSSAYSTTHNRKLYTLTHMVGSLLGSTRAQNAYLIEKTNLSSLMRNAIFIAYACHHSHELAPIGAAAGQAEALKIARKKLNPQEEVLEGDAVFAAINREPDTRNPLAWYSYWKGLNFEDTEKLKKWVKFATERVSETRENTIGQWVKAYGSDTSSN